jgi:hypothetical protein
MRSIRRSRSAVGLLAVAFLIAASGCGAEPTDQMGSPSATDATDIADEPSATWAPAVTDEPARTVTSTAVAVSAPFDAMLEGSEYVPVRWLVPWDDGFLAVAVRYPPQPLPDQLPPEIAALFPPEVNALFPDGLPPTQQEAMDILREAGLLDVVMDILNQHPEAMDAVQSAPQPDPELLASWSTDGDSWVPVEMAPPGATADVSQLAVAGDRLTIAGTVPPDEDGGSSTVTVASTTDLENWNTASFPLTQTEGLSESEQMWVTPIAVAADDEHWVVRIMIDVMSGPSGSEPRAEMWSGAWGGEPATSDAGQQSWMMLATSDGFLDLGERVMFSPDGQTWTEVPGKPPNVLFQVAAPMDDDVLAITGTPYGESSIVVLDASGTMIDEVEITELSDGFSAWSSTSSPAFIVAAAIPAPDAQTIVVEHDGFELTQEYSEVVAYQLVELSTGDVVVEESVDLRTTEVTEDGPFEYLAEDMSGITITDPETGATIVEIPRSAIDKAWEDARGDETTPDAVQDVGQPDLWLLATADAETWLLEDLEQGADGSNGPPLAATNGTTVLVGTPGWESGTDVWQRFALPE